LGLVTWDRSPARHSFLKIGSAQNLSCGLSEQAELELALAKKSVPLSPRFADD
jgi:hypothetical protein